MSKISKKLKDLRLSLPELAKPVGLYVPALQTGSLVTTSGQLPFSDGRLIYQGRVGKEVSLENAQRSAKTAIINALAAIKWVIKDLDKITQIVRMNGFVCSGVGFNDQPKVINAASELLITLFGDQKGAHTRTAIGCLELPMGACVEIDLTVAVKS